MDPDPLPPGPEVAAARRRNQSFYSGGYSGATCRSHGMVCQLPCCTKPFIFAQSNDLYSWGTHGSGTGKWPKRGNAMVVRRCPSASTTSAPPRTTRAVHSVRPVQTSVRVRVVDKGATRVCPTCIPSGSVVHYFVQPSSSREILCGEPRVSAANRCETSEAKAQHQARRGLWD
jgi:hypothetical protein